MPIPGPEHNKGVGKVDYALNCAAVAAGNDGRCQRSFAESLSRTRISPKRIVARELRSQAGHRARSVHHRCRRSVGSRRVDTRMLSRRASREESRPAHPHRDIQVSLRKLPSIVRMENALREPNREGSLSTHREPLLWVVDRTTSNKHPIRERYRDFSGSQRRNRWSLHDQDLVPQ